MISLKKKLQKRVRYLPDLRDSQKLLLFPSCFFNCGDNVIACVTLIYLLFLKNSANSQGRITDVWQLTFSKVIMLL